MTGRGETHRLERWVHWILLTGLVLSGLMLVTGLGLALLRGGPRPDGPPPGLPSLFRAAASGDGVAWLDLGLLALIGTPVLRVAVLALGWWLAGERRFAIVALAVLGLLAAGLLLGLG
jgi:uncharacterized membrane protein